MPLTLKPLFLFAHGAGAPSSRSTTRIWRDSLCPLDVLARVRGEMRAVNDLHVVEGGDHSLLVTKTQLKASVETQDDVEQRILMTIQNFVGGHTDASR